jgi:hypothetical protein
MARNQGASASASASGGTGFAGLLTILFVALKLLHKIGWSWWWVVSPLWIGAAVTVFVLLVVVGIAVVIGLLKR